jgi:hypothetical protein
MELTAEQLEAIQAASREIEYGRITASFTGNPSNIVDIVAEKYLRFQREKAAAPAQGDHAGARRGSPKKNHEPI